jgi:hypothetical protein
MGEIRNANKVSRGKSEGKRPLQKLKCRYRGNIKMGLPEIVREDAE